MQQECRCGWQVSFQSRGFTRLAAAWVECRGRYSLAPDLEVQERFARMPTYLSRALMPFQREVRSAPDQAPLCSCPWSTKCQPHASPFGHTPPPT
jgi:hypothetical protein